MYLCHQRKDKASSSMQYPIFQINDTTSFQAQALELFRYQALHNPVYRSFLAHLRCDPLQVKDVEQIPFLPVECFKSLRIRTGDAPAAVVFTSSGTTGQITSRHEVPDTELYKEVSIRAFERVYGSLQDYAILALLPAYLEREGSSLVYMAQVFMEASGHAANGFYLYNQEELLIKLKYLEEKGQKTLLLGVTFALLDFAEKFPIPLKNTLVMETGGMKGRRKEMLREEVHAYLQAAFQVEQVHSEYGMTELLSQAYAPQSGLFQTPPWMKILIRETNDPFNYQPVGAAGGINIIDLANKDSCAFLSTKDIGKVHPDGRFEVLGRFDHSDIRGCNLMAL